MSIGIGIGVGVGIDGVGGGVGGEIVALLTAGPQPNRVGSTPVVFT